MNLGGIEELVDDKGYHSGPMLTETKAAGVRTYIPEKQQPGKRHWVGKEEEQQPVYENRRRLFSSVIARSASRGTPAVE